MFRYTLTTVLMLLLAFLVQQFLPAFTGMYHSRILLVQLVFLCAAVTVGTPTMLLLAFVGGFLWDAHSYIGPHGGDPEIYTQPVETLRFGYSILLFAAMGYLMQGVQPLLRQGKWQVSALLSGVAIACYLAAEYAVISFIRGELPISPSVIFQITYSSILTMLFSPIIFWILFTIASSFDHAIYQVSTRRSQRNY